MIEERPMPIWFHDPTDESRYSVAENGTCPADGTTLTVSNDRGHCTYCRRVFNPDGKRTERCWWSGTNEAPDPSKDELRALIVTLLRSARPHPLEHPTMWNVWGHVCIRVGLNPEDFRVATKREAPTDAG